MRIPRNQSRKKLAPNQQPELPKYDWEDLNPIFLTKKDLCNLVNDIAERDKIPDAAMSAAMGFSPKSGNRFRKWLDTESDDWAEIENAGCEKFLEFLRTYYSELIPPNRPVVIVSSFSHGS